MDPTRLPLCCKTLGHRGLTRHQTSGRQGQYLLPAADQVCAGFPVHCTRLRNLRVQVVVAPRAGRRRQRPFLRDCTLVPDHKLCRNSQLSACLWGWQKDHQYFSGREMQGGKTQTPHAGCVPAGSARGHPRVYPSPSKVRRRLASFALMRANAATMREMPGNKREHRRCPG